MSKNRALASGARSCGFESLLAYKANFNKNKRKALIFEGFFFLCILKFTHVYSNFNATPLDPAIRNP